MNAGFSEAMSLIKPLGIPIGDLYVEGYAFDSWFVMARCSLDDELQGLRAQLSGAVRLCEVSISTSALSRLKW